MKSKKTKKVKPVIAWAVVNSEYGDRIRFDDYIFVDESDKTPLLIFRTKRQALDRRVTDVGDKIIKVKISPI